MTAGARADRSADIRDRCRDQPRSRMTAGPRAGRSSEIRDRRRDRAVAV